MRIEASSRGKVFDRPQDNEDALVALPGAGYAVIDGVTDRSQRDYGDMRAGRFAATTVARRLAAWLAAPSPSTNADDPAQAIISALSKALRAGYDAHGRLADAQSSPSLRAGCTLALVLHEGDHLRLVAIGDSGIRLSGPDGPILVHDGAKPLDHVTSMLRRETWRLQAAAGESVDACRAVSDLVVRHGLGAKRHGLSAGDVDLLRERVGGVCRQDLPDVPGDEIALLVEHGIDAQRRFANRDDVALGYGVIDGFDVPSRHVFSQRVPAAGVRRIELFTDGYFDPPEEFGVDAWEASFAAVERLDPHKLERWPSTKGSTEQAWTDDRTYIGVALD